MTPVSPSDAILTVTIIGVTFLIEVAFFALIGMF